MKEKIYKILPNYFQQLLITLYNYRAYKVRYGGRYSAFRKEFYQNRNLPLDALKTIQKTRYESFIKFCINHSEYYQKLYSDIDSPEKLKNLKSLPIVGKEDLRKNIDEVIIQTKEKLEKSKTGGTTGKSLEVRFRSVNSQERFAMLDDFRNRFGYELGKKTAWFSGKNLLTDNDVRKNRFWKTDTLYKVRYYSTFHIKDDYLKYYVENLILYRPQFLVGFPSSILEIAKYGLNHGFDFPENSIKAIFPTAETITKTMKETIEKFFKTKMYNQYASSEGAPFIFECEKGNLHIELQSGIFEVLDENNEQTQSGRLIVTSFTTEATPLIRYDIGDSITLEDKACNCGNNNPLVKEILGRIDDFIYSPQNGKINLGNISNTLKDIKGIIKFQAIQNELNKIELLIVKDNCIYNKEIEQKFIKNWRERVGNEIELIIFYVNEISVEKSGKFRIVKNNIKHLIS
ncbi:phenylacetate--CoA ligase family protein [Chryseobacterium indoltheticum]|uniref:phenylacetate--CoA ligase family protein n=1 Tax=Chryseobacterium indoltheticum TaxID=254 RepID=UPI0019116211|nr:phenylacetate--CoA ligase family protein [Chryseobacterium indoltheticum]QQQ28055.1 phenylacetate--CoA ligase family protein [Chryseobacterium indoltheticum]